VAGPLFLVAFPPTVVAFVALRGRQPVHIEAFEDAPHAGLAYLHVVVALEVHLDFARSEVIVLPQVDDLSDDIDVRRVGAGLRPLRPISQALDTFSLEASQPPVVGLPADAVVATRRRHVPGDFHDMTKDRKPTTRLTVQ